MKIYWKWTSKNDQKSGVYNCSKWRAKNRQKSIENDPLKNCQKSTQNCLKFDMPRGGQNRQKSTSGDRDPKYGIFWNFALFYKSSPLFDPHFRPPKRALLENPFPTNRLCFCSNGGVKKVTFWGVGGRTARTEKCRHYYIANFGFGGSKLIDFYRFSTSATTARYR
jgi:hypothetical protein